MATGLGPPIEMTRADKDRFAAVLASPDFDGSGDRPMQLPQNCGVKVLIA
jgi:hypothetical protein